MDSRSRSNQSGKAFFDWDGPMPGPVTVDGRTGSFPGRYYSATAFTGVFPASIEAVKRLLPSETLFPVKLGRGSAAVAIQALRYEHVGIFVDGHHELLTPYGEIAINLLCTHGRSAPRIVPLLQLFENDSLQLGAYVLFMPVTSMQARDLGRVLFGMPKFMADMDCREEGESRVVRLEEAGMHALTLTVRAGGMARTEQARLHLYSELDGRLARTDVPTRSFGHVRLFGRPAHLQLGTHPVAKVLRDLGIGAEGRMSSSLARHQFLLPPPVRLDEPARRVEDFVGQEIQRGRYTLAYDDRMVIDLYGGFAPEAPEAEEIEVPPPTPPPTEPEIRA